MSATAAPLPPSALPPGQILRRSADRVTGWFYRSCPSLGLLPASPRQFRPSKIAGPEPTQTPARQPRKPAKRKTAPSNPPAPRPAGEFGRARTAQNATPPRPSAPRQRRKAETESLIRRVTAESSAHGLPPAPAVRPSLVAFRKPGPGADSPR